MYNGEENALSPGSADAKHPVETIVPQLTAMESDSSSDTPTEVAAEVAVVTADLSSSALVSTNPHFITVTVAGDDVPHSTFVQYVETDIYTGQAPSQMVYPVYAVSEYASAGSSSQVSQSAQPHYYTASGSAFVGAGATSVNATITSDPYILSAHLSSEDEAMIVQQPTSTESDSPSNHTISSGSAESSHNYIDSPSVGSSQQLPNTNGDSNTGSSTRVSPITVTWLMNNYETAEGVSLPRSTLYSHYLRHCSEHKLDPVNAASFGKLIRSVFLGLRTRRLGTRGNSKYHYYGIRIKPGSDLTQVDEKPPSNSAPSYSNNNAKSHKVKSNFKSNVSDGTTQYLGDGNNAVPVFPEILFNEDSHLPEDCSFEDVDTFKDIYREHCEAFLDAILNLEFNTIETLWREFWRASNNNNGDECEDEKYLSKSKLYKLCTVQPIQVFILEVDFVFYQNVVEVLLPDVLRPIPSALTQSIRNFAKGLENWLALAMSGLPNSLVSSKLTAVSAFAQMLRRYTSLNHLAQAARAVLQNSSQISQMLSDLNRVDFNNVQEQAAYVCQCDPMIVRNLEDDFKFTLQQQNSLEQWASWLKTVMKNALKDYEDKPTYTEAARQFLLKWSFYSSMIIRDLTLRSAASFGSFHLIRLLYDEYMFYLVEHEIARFRGTSAIAVMAEIMKAQSTSSTPNDCNVETPAEEKRMKLF
ncbi:transcription factor RFX3-like isoform X2 [Ctenocephalides felis]|nr:transcription factor RFX3-like isoform X2 [Ctenocephalides felis]